MSNDIDVQRKKPDGSAYKDHLAGLTERNAASQKAGRKERQEYELGKLKDRQAAERRQAAEIRAKG